MGVHIRVRGFLFVCVFWVCVYLCTSLCAYLGLLERLSV